MARKLNTNDTVPIVITHFLEKSNAFSNSLEYLKPDTRVLVVGGRDSNVPLPKNYALRPFRAYFQRKFRLQETLWEVLDSAGKMCFRVSSAKVYGLDEGTQILFLVGNDWKEAVIGKYPRFRELKRESTKASHKFKLVRRRHLRRPTWLDRIIDEDS